MPKTEFEKKVIIKARRLRRKKKIWIDMMAEQDKYLKDYYGEDRKFTTEEVKKAMQDYIKNAGKISVQEKKERNLNAK